MVEPPMSDRDLTLLLADLYREMTGGEPAAEVLEAITTSREDNHFDPAHDVPAWMPAMLEAVLARRAVGPTILPPDDGSAASFLDEVARLVPGWTVDEQGEYYTMTFPPLGVEVVVSREALTPEGRHCYAYTVRPLSA